MAYENYENCKGWNLYKDSPEIKEVLMCIAAGSQIYLAVKDHDLRKLIHIIAFSKKYHSFSYVDRSLNVNSIPVFKCYTCNAVMRELPYKTTTWCNFPKSCSCRYPNYCNSMIEYYYCINGTKWDDDGHRLCGETFGDTPSDYVGDTLKMKSYDDNNCMVIAPTKEAIITMIQGKTSKKYSSRTILRKQRKNIAIPS